MTNRVVILTALNRINNEMQGSVSDTCLTTILKDFRTIAKNEWVYSLKPFNYFKNMVEINTCDSLYAKWVYKFLVEESGVSKDANTLDDAKIEVIGRRIARSILKPQTDSLLVPFLNERTAYVTALSLLMLSPNDWKNKYYTLPEEAKTLRNYILCILYFSVTTPTDDVIRATLESAKHGGEFMAYVANLILN